MRHSVPLPKTLAIVAMAALLAGCGDDITDPRAILESAEAEAVLRSAADLPALPTLIERAGDPAASADRLAFYRAQELWSAGTARDDRGARARRRMAVRYAAPGLVARLEPGTWDEVEAGLLEWIGTAEAMLQHVDLPRVHERLKAARALLRRAAGAATADDRASTLLLASAELIETTPRFVARSLTARADVAVTRAAAGRSEPDAELERAIRLKDWAGQAVEAGDYLLAIQRAYYAIQLVETR